MTQASKTSANTALTKREGLTRCSMSWRRLSCDPFIFTITLHYFFFQFDEAVTLDCAEFSFIALQVQSGRVSLPVFSLFH